MSRPIPALVLGLLIALAIPFAASSNVVDASAEGALLDADAVDALILNRGPMLVEARLRLRLDDLDIELERRPEAPMLEWRLVPGGLDIQSMLLQPISALLTRDLRTRKADVAREKARIEYARMTLDALVAGRRSWHAAIVAERRLAIARERTRIAEARLRWRQARQSQGEDGATALLDAQVALRVAIADMEGAQAMTSRRRAALAERLGLADAEALSLPNDLPAALVPWSDDAGAAGGAPPAPDPLPIRLARIELQAADVESLLKHHSGATWMPALGLESGAMDTALRITFNPPAWARGRLERSQSETAIELATRRLDHARRLQALSLAAAMRSLNARRHSEAATVERLQAARQSATLIEIRQARGESSPVAVWAARTKHLDTERALWQAREATLAAALDVVLALGGGAGESAIGNQPARPQQQTDGR